MRYVIFASSVAFLPMVFVLDACGVPKDAGAKKLAQLNDTMHALQPTLYASMLAAPTGPSDIVNVTAACADGGGFSGQFKPLGNASFSAQLAFSACKDPLGEVVNGGPLTLVFSQASGATGATNAGAIDLVFTYDGGPITVQTQRGTDTFTANDLSVSSRPGATSTPVTIAGSTTVNGASFSFSAEAFVVDLAH